VNEESLKRLNEYINQLHCQRRVSPLKLTFYVRPQATDEAPAGIETTHESGLYYLYSSDFCRLSKFVHSDLFHIKDTYFTTSDFNLQFKKCIYVYVELGNFRSVQIVLATQNLHDAVREVLSSCSLPLHYVDTIAALQASGARSGLSHSTTVSPQERFSQTVQSSIVERFYGFGAHDLPHVRVRRMARDTLRLLVCLMHLHCCLLLLESTISFVILPYSSMGDS